MQAAIDAYFKQCEGHLVLDANGNAITDHLGQPIMVGKRPPTVTGLALALGLSGRQALLLYQDRDAYQEIIERAKARVEMYAEERLYDRDGARGAMFTLSHNFKWTQPVEENRITPAQELEYQRTMEIVRLALYGDRNEKQEIITSWDDDKEELTIDDCK